MARFHVTLPLVAWLRPQAFHQVMSEELGKAMQSLISSAADDIRGNTPVDRGVARASIVEEVMRGTPGDVFIRGQVTGGKQAPHLKYLEEGTRPHWPPSEPIKGWARRVLGDETLWFVVARAISRRGTRAHHMFRNANRRLIPRVRPAFLRAKARAVERLRRRG